MYMTHHFAELAMQTQGHRDKFHFEGETFRKKTT
jgi:hypothetical protein